jgi:hypothetical protein
MALWFSQWCRHSGGGCKRSTSFRTFLSQTGPQPDVDLHPEVTGLTSPEGTNIVGTGSVIVKLLIIRDPWGGRPSQIREV